LDGEIDTEVQEEKGYGKSVGGVWPRPRADERRKTRTERLRGKKKSGPEKGGASSKRKVGEKPRGHLSWKKKG